MFMFINDEEKDLLINNYVIANRDDLMNRFSTEVKELLEEGCAEDESDALFLIIEEAYDCCENEIIQPLVHEADDVGNYANLIGDDSWCVEEIRQFIINYIPEFVFNGRDYVDYSAEAFPSEENCEEKGSGSGWPFDSFSDQFEDWEEEKAFWEAAL